MNILSTIAYSTVTAWARAVGIASPSTSFHILSFPKSRFLDIERSVANWRGWDQCVPKVLGKGNYCIPIYRRGLAQVWKMQSFFCWTALQWKGFQEATFQTMAKREVIELLKRTHSISATIGLSFWLTDLRFWCRGFLHVVKPRKYMIVYRSHDHHAYTKDFRSSSWITDFQIMNIVSMVG